MDGTGAAVASLPPPGPHPGAGGEPGPSGRGGATAPSPRVRRAPRRRSTPTLVLLVVVVPALLLGAAAGWVAGTHAGRDAGTRAGRAAGTVAAAVPRATGGAIDVHAVLARVEPAVVSIDTKTSVQRGPFSGIARGAGSGIVVSADGDVVTNAHVVEGAESITVTFPGSTRARPADLVMADAAADLALVHVRGVEGLAVASLGRSSALEVGDDVVAIGNALALDGGPSVTRGIVSALDRSIETQDGTLEGLLQTDAAISSGNSGGALVNAAGEVVGLNTAVATGTSTVAAENIGFAIPIDTVRAALPALRG